MIDLEEYRAWDGLAMAERVRSGEVTAAELEAACRHLVAELDGSVHAVADVVPEGEVVAAGDPAAPFAGVPFAVKELLAVPELPWTMGSRLLAGYRVTEVSPYVARLRAAGLRTLCSTASSELGLLGSTESALRGTTTNPWRAGTSAGGSSGGSAAAVAAGIVPLAHANDGGGSIRYPAAVTGLFGFKPTNGRCEPTGQDSGGLASLVVDHVVTRSVRDSAAVLAATERRGTGLDLAPVGLVAGPSDRRLRVATLERTLRGAAPDPAVAAALARTQALLEDLGHHLVDVAPPAIDGEALSTAFFTSAALTVAGVAAMVAPLLGRPPGPDELEPFTLELVAWAAAFAPDAGAVAEATFARARAAYNDLFAHVDVVLSPTVARPPWPVGTLAPDLGRAELIARTEQLVGYTPIHNVSRGPATSVPLEEVDGLPVGMHLAAAPGEERLLLELAFELEAARPWAQRRPDLGQLASWAPCPRS